MPNKTLLIINYMTPYQVTTYWTIMVYAEYWSYQKYNKYISLVPVPINCQHFNNY